MKVWRLQDSVLVEDFNDDVYRGNITGQLADADLNMTEQILKNTGAKTPPPHKRGSKSMCGVFC